MKSMQYAEIRSLPYKYNVPLKHVINLKMLID